MRRAAIGFKGLALAPVTENTLTSYAASAGEALPYAGSMSRTAKESTTDLYYDDDLYAQIKNVSGEDVEIRVAEVPLDRMAALGLGDYDEETNTLEGDFSVAGKEYALRCVVDTVDHLPYYFNYRVFQLTGIRFDNFTTKQDSVTVCEVIITGVFKRPALPSLKPYAVMQLADDRSNEAACTAFLTDAEPSRACKRRAGRRKRRTAPASAPPPAGERPLPPSPKITQKSKGAMAHVSHQPHESPPRRPSPRRRARVPALETPRDPGREIPHACQRRAVPARRAHGARLRDRAHAHRAVSAGGAAHRRGA